MRNPTMNHSSRTLMFSISFLLMFAQGSAQNRRRVDLPPELVRSLSEEDRECVRQNGGVNKMFTAEPIYLKADNSAQVLVQGSYPCECGAQNCAFWIYRRNANGHELLLAIDSAVDVRPGTGRTNGYRDIVADSHSSAFETWIRTYKFDGKQYQFKSCIIRSYLDANGRQLKRPRFLKCG